MHISKQWKSIDWSEKYCSKNSKFGTKTFIKLQTIISSNNIGQLTSILTRTVKRSDVKIWQKIADKLRQRKIKTKQKIFPKKYLRSYLMTFPLESITIITKFSINNSIKIQQQQQQQQQQQKQQQQQQLLWPLWGCKKKICLYRL